LSDFDLRNIDRDRDTIADLLFQEIDVLVLPTLADAPPTLNEVKRSGNPNAVSWVNTFFCNYYGLPAISVPCGFHSNGLPVGLQIVGPPHGDGLVLDVARAFQRKFDPSGMHIFPSL
jgi:aspartyl-tRNA(Asn)/glutamyl-tRNA(Gln) amidotransferase subunit A